MNTLLNGESDLKQVFDRCLWLVEQGERVQAVKEWRKATGVSLNEALLNLGMKTPTQSEH